MRRLRFFAVFVMTVVFLVPMIGAAQEGPMPLTWVGLNTVKPGTEMQYPKLFAKYNKPLLDEMVADGRALSWAVGYELAGPGGFNYAVWVNMPGWAGMGEVEAGFDAHWEGLPEEEIEAMMSEWLAVIEPGEEKYQLLRHIVFNAAPDATYKYLRLSNFTVKPGHGSDVVKMYKSFMVPIYDQLLQDGVISAYGVIEQAVHSDPSFTHQFWITFANLADLEKVEKAFQGAEISDGDQVTRNLAFLKMMDQGTHYDRLIRVIMQND